MKRLLLIAYYYDEPLMGAIRARRLARWLPRFGWDPLVLTHAPTPGCVAPPDAAPTLRPAFLDWAAVWRRLRPRTTAGPTPTAGSAPRPVARDIRLTAFINRWFMVPDKQAPWRRPAIRAARRAARAQPFDLIFSTLEPRTNHRVAAALAPRLRIPCVMEYRDLWTGSPYWHLAQPTRWHARLHARMEARALAAATRVTAVSDGIRHRLAAAYGDRLPGPIALHTNFYDPDEFAAAPPERPAVFTIVYAGALYASRSPEAFFAGCRQFIDRHGLTPDQFRFRWAGQLVGLRGLPDWLARCRLDEYLDFLGQLPHAQALAELQHAHAALVVQAPNDDVHVPGKLFEALGARTPVLLMANAGEVVDLVRRANAGIIAAHEPDAVCEALTTLWHRTTQGDWPFNESVRLEYAADAAVGKLAGWLDEILADARRSM